MVSIERELDRYITLLRNKIRERGLTQLEVQTELGWGRSYISQILTKQKNLRIDQVFKILSVLGVKPETFFADLYGPTPRGQPQPRASSTELPAQELQRLTSLLRGLIKLLRQKGLITESGLSEAVERARFDLD